MELDHCDLAIVSEKEVDMALIKPISGYVASILLVIALIMYLRAVLHGKVYSNKVTWGVWVIVNFMLSFYYYQTVGLVNTIWVSLVACIGSVAIFVSLVIYGKKGQWTWLEKVILVAVGIILVLKIILDSSIIALTLTILTDAIGSVPLIVTVYKDPKSEYGPSWYMGLIAHSLNLVAVNRWDYANTAYPIYFVLLMITVSFLIRFPLSNSSRKKMYC